ncbi:AMP-binding protein [Spirochaeta dissipatitropha]
MQLDTAACRRFLSDFVQSELSSMRDYTEIPHPVSDENPDGLLNSAPLFCDSMEIAMLAGKLNDIFFIEESGLEDLLLAKPGIMNWSNLLETSLSYYSSHIKFFTSGSSGSPKKIVHQTDLLKEEVETVLSLIHEGRKRIVSLVPAHHIYGFLFSILLPSLSGLPAVRQHGAFPELTEGDIVLSIPAWIRQWRLQDRSLPAGITVLSSTSPLSTEDADWLNNSSIDYIEIFGSSETSGIGWRRHSEAAFCLFPYWKYSHAGLTRSGLEAILEPPDNLEWLESRKFIPHGRKDHALQIMGKNVYPAQIEKLFAGLDQVSEASVRSYDSQAGTRLKIFIVPSSAEHRFPEDNISLEQSLRSWAAHSLDSVQRPSSYMFGTELPRNSMAKQRDF